jgi:hypothetical protein
MPFDAGDLLGSLFPEVPPAPMPERPTPKPPPTLATTPQRPAGRGCPESAGTPNGRENESYGCHLGTKPRSRLPNAIPTPPAGEWLAIWRRAPQTTPPPTPCGWCGSAVYWQHVVGLTFICPRCHPPAFPFHVAGWFQVVATEDGPQVVRIGEMPSKG